MSTSISFVSGNNLQTITFDTATVKPMFESEIADHPIEKGADASDNARDKPETVSIDGMFTDYPLSIHGGGVGQPREEGRAADILKQLLYLKSKGVRFGISTSLRQYSSMLIRSIAPTTDKMKGAVKLTIVFARVLIVASETVNVVASSRNGQKKIDKGKQPTKEAAAEPLKSSLAKIVDSDVVKKSVDVVGNLIK